MIQPESSYWREFPFRGEVEELIITGNGKDCTLQVRVPDGRAFGIPLRDPQVEVSCCEGIIVTTTGEDDTGLAVAYRPQSGWRMEIAHARIGYPGSEEDWASHCEDWARMSRSRWPIDSSMTVDGMEVQLAAKKDLERSKTSRQDLSEEAAIMLSLAEMVIEERKAGAGVKADFVLNLLTQKFGPVSDATREVVCQANADQLHHYAWKIVFATELKQVLG